LSLINSYRVLKYQQLNFKTEGLSVIFSKKQNICIKNTEGVLIFNRNYLAVSFQQLAFSHKTQILNEFVVEKADF
jgi:hypothetical protein